MGLHKIYRVVSDEEALRQGDLRVVDKSGEDYLYPAAWFVPLGLPPRVRGSLLRRRRAWFAAQRSSVIMSRALQGWCPAGGTQWDAAYRVLQRFTRSHPANSQKICDLVL